MIETLRDSNYPVGTAFVFEGYSFMLILNSEPDLVTHVVLYYDIQTNDLHVTKSFLSQVQTWGEPDNVTILPPDGHRVVRSGNYIYVEKE